MYKTIHWFSRTCDCVFELGFETAELTDTRAYTLVDRSDLTFHVDANSLEKYPTITEMVEWPFCSVHNHLEAQEAFELVKKENEASGFKDDFRKVGMTDNTPSTCKCTIIIQTHSDPKSTAPKHIVRDAHWLPENKCEFHTQHADYVEHYRAVKGEDRGMSKLKMDALANAPEEAKTEIAFVNGKQIELAGLDEATRNVIRTLATSTEVGFKEECKPEFSFDEKRQFMVKVPMALKDLGHSVQLVEAPSIK